MIAIIDYGVGNLFSLKSSLSHIGAEAKVTGDANEIKRADKLILPGVGAFGDAAEKLRVSGLWDVVKEQAAQKKPLLGICLGMQLLFERSSEYGDHEGLGLIKGRVDALSKYLPAGLKVPHMGWNRLNIVKDDPLFAEFPKGGSVYYVHSYFAVDCDEAVTANSEYGIPVTGAVRHENVAGTQFHPEKSGSAGLSLLRAFAKE